MIKMQPRFLAFVVLHLSTVAVVSAATAGLGSGLDRGGENDEDHAHGHGLDAHASEETKGNYQVLLELRNLLYGRFENEDEYYDSPTKEFGELMAELSQSQDRQAVKELLAPFGFRQQPADAGPWVFSIPYAPSLLTRNDGVAPIHIWRYNLRRFDSYHNPLPLPGYWSISPATTKLRLYLQTSH
ncbi:unnamed protein product [Amoebophrya sp. A120]|nr:unnamed protein product [Amoebophrya sp. A120]|eukprot:GSA120T00007285001.1